jgi:hypothetical protein
MRAKVKKSLSRCATASGAAAMTVEAHVPLVTGSPDLY